MSQKLGRGGRMSCSRARLTKILMENLGLGACVRSRPARSHDFSDVKGHDLSRP